MHEMANKMMFELYLVSLKKQRCLVKRYWRLAQIPTLMLTNQNEVSGEELKPFPERLYVVPPRVANGFGLLENERYVVTETKVVKPFPERLTARARVDECNSTLSEALNSSNFSGRNMKNSIIMEMNASNLMSMKMVLNWIRRWSPIV